MPETDQEVFEHFRSGYGGTREVALIAYARYAETKYDWVNHELARLQRPPTNEEVAGWIAALPNSRFDEIRDGAINLLQAISEDYMKPRIEEERARAVERSILGRVDAAALRVERATSFWRNVVPSTFIGVVSSFLLALILIAGSVILQRDPTVVGLLKQLSAPSQSSTTRP